MQPIEIENESLKIGKPEGWNEDKLGNCSALSVQLCEGAGGLPLMLSKWHPDEADLAVLNNGGSIYLGIYGTTHPVVTVYSSKESKVS